MKISFSDKFVNASSFIDLCNTARFYGFDGIEISNAKEEKSAHTDSIFRSSNNVDAKRKLLNRNIAVSVIEFPQIITENTDTEALIKDVEYAALARANGVVIKFDKQPRPGNALQLHIVLL
jgi:hypothetical protein